MDLASIAHAVAALECGRGKGWRQWTAWDKYVLGQATLALLLYGPIQMTSRSERRGGAFGDVLRILSRSDPWQVAITGSLTAAEEEKAITVARQRISVEEGDIRGGLDRVMADSSNFHPWIDWVIRTTWEDTVKQNGNLIDDRFEPEIARILRFSTAEKKQLKADCGNVHAIRSWIRPLSPPPPEVIQAFVLSALLRGRLIEIQAEQAKNHYAFHPLREPVLSPIGQPKLEGHRVPPSARRLAAIIVSSALTHRSPESGACSWADNISVVRRAMHYESAIHFSDNQGEGAAVDEAVKIARDLELQIEWAPVNLIHDEVATLGGFKQLAGIVLAPIGHLKAKAAKWVVIKTLGPGLKRLLESTAAALERNPFLLRRLADISENTPGKIFMNTSDRD